MTAAIAGKDTGVHQARVASRRLREALPVLTRGLHHTKAGKAQRKLKRLTQALGTVRELDVTLHVLDELAVNPSVPQPALADVRAHVIEERERRRTLMLDRLKHVDTDKLARRLVSVREAIGAAPDAQGWRHALALTIARRASRLEKAIALTGQIYAPEGLHEVRIAAKKLRYALEIADESGAAPCAEALRTIKRAQDTLGRLHDLQILQHHVAAVGAAPRQRRATPDAGLDVLARMLEEECRQLHGRYVASQLGLADALAVARRDLPVLLTARRKGARAVKMALVGRPASRPWIARLRERDNGASHAINARRRSGAREHVREGPAGQSPPASDGWRCSNSI